MQIKLPKNIKALGVVSLLNDASTDMIYPLIPIFLTKTLGASYATVGLIEGIAESTASLLKVFSGWISDKMHKRKPLAVIGYGLSMISKPLLALAQVPWHVLAVRFSDRVGKGVRQAPRDALIAESINEEHIGYAYGFHKMMDTIGATIGPILAMILLPILNDNLRMLFLLSFAASFFALLTLIFGVKEKSSPKKQPIFHKLSFKLLPRPYKIFLLGLAVFTIGNSSDAFLFLKAQHVGVAAALIPALYAASNLVFASLATSFGKLADKIGPQKIMIGGYAVFGVVYLGFAFASSPLAVYLLFPFYGIFSAMTDSIQKTITVQTTDPTLKGTMLGMTHATLGICQLPASIMAGFLWEKFGASVPFIFSTATSIAAIFILMISFSLHKSQKPVLQ